jgi:hypothetical protein
VKVVVPPSSTVCGVSGAIAPLLPALGVTTCVGSGANVALTVQSAVTGAVVYELPLSEPPQPVTSAMP